MIVKGLVVAVALMFVSVQAAMAQSSSSSPTRTAVAVDELETLSQKWMEAAQHNDMPTLERLMAPEFTLVHPSQETVTTRAQWLSNLAGVETKQFKYQHLKVVHYGPTLAVVSSIFFSDAVKDGVSFGGGGTRTSCMDVWEKRAGQWQVVTRYATRREELPPPPALSKEPLPTQN